MATLDNFRLANLFNRFNRLVQTLLGISLIIGVNYVSSRHFERLDLTENRRYSLAPETRSYLRELDQPIRVIVTLNPNPEDAELRQLYRNMRLLLDEYTHFANQGGRTLLEVEYINVYTERQEAEFLARNYELDQPEVVLLDNGERQRVLLPTDLVETREGQVSAFTGERALTSALIDLSALNPHRVYFITGHGEMALEGVSASRGLSILAEALRRRNYELDTLDLTGAGGIPADADALILPSPQGPLHPGEVERLRTYLSDRAGRLLITIDPLTDPGLEPLFNDWAIKAGDRVVLDPGREFQSASGESIIRVFEPHPITRFLIDNGVSVLSPLPRPVRRDEGAPADDRRTTRTLAYSSPESWAESDYREKDNLRFNPESDLPGPVGLAVVSERRISSALGIDLPGGKLAVFGSGGLFANARIEAIGNYMLFQNTLAWLLDQEALAAIPARPVQSVQLALSQDQLVQLGLIVLTLPGGIALFGLTVFIVRKM